MVVDTQVWEQIMAPLLSALREMHAIVEGDTLRQAAQEGDIVDSYRHTRMDIADASGIRLWILGTHQARSWIWMNIITKFCSRQHKIRSGAEASVGEDPSSKFSCTFQLQIPSCCGYKNLSKCTLKFAHVQARNVEVQLQT